MYIEHSIEKQIETLLVKITLELGLAPSDSLRVSAAPTHTKADFATNWPLAVFTQLGSEEKENIGVTSPFSLAEFFAAKLVLKSSDKKIELIATATAAKPGFINIIVTDQALATLLPIIADSNKELVPQENQGQKFVVEFGDPNPFKEFHIGHLFTTIAGETIARLLTATGATANRACYQGDVGMHVAKSLWGIQHLFKQENLDLETVRTWALSKRIAFLGRAYAAGATAFEITEEAKEEMKKINFLGYKAGQERLVKEQNFTPIIDFSQFMDVDPQEYEEIKTLYFTGRAWSLEYFETLYARLGTKFKEHIFESESGERGLAIVREYLKKEVFEESNGAVIFLGEEYGLHNRVFVNSMGLPTYEAKDLGLPFIKEERLGIYDRSIIITGNEVDDYFKVILMALSRINPDLAKKTTHLSHGMVKLPDGKMSSRTGKIITGEWLLDEAQAQVMSVLEKNKPELSEEDKKELANNLAVAAVKYALLKSNLGSDISFSFEESLSMTGNSGPYVEYTYVRCQSILRKVAKVMEKRSITECIDTLLNIKSYLNDQLAEEERDLLLNLSRYSDVVSKAAQNYAPHLVCTYLFELSQNFSRFYENCPVLEKDATKLIPVQERRAILVASVARVLREGMEVLGMPVVEQM